MAPARAAAPSAARPRPTPPSRPWGVCVPVTSARPRAAWRRRAQRDYGVGSGPKFIGSDPQMDFISSAFPSPPEAHATPDTIQVVSVAVGEAMELPCPSPRTLHGDEYLSWFRSSAAGSPTVLVAQAPVVRPVSYAEKPRRESRPKLLGNHSLWLEGITEGDAGRYWCAMLGQHYKYQNWRVYDVSVLRGSQLSARAADGASCSVLLCSVIPPRRLDSVTWLEGKGPVRGQVKSFWGEGSALLLVCPGEGLPEPRSSRRPRIIRCIGSQNKGVSFSLAAPVYASPAPCATSTGWDLPWLLMLMLVAGQGLAILALSIVLWRRRALGTPSRAAATQQFKPEIQVYENIHLAHLGILGCGLPIPIPWLVEEVAAPREAGREEGGREQERAGEPLQARGCVAQVLLATPVPQSIGARPCPPEVQEAEEDDRRAHGWLASELSSGIWQKVLCALRALRVESEQASVTGIQHHPACVAAHHCSQVETKLSGDVTSTTRKDSAAPETYAEAPWDAPGPQTVDRIVGGNAGGGGEQRRPGHLE
ncbi:lymphocyte antigen 6 complex locus protein G6f [Tenrec ecaudatus]|uniref:lymphocyte antigen 6 complex locus protein G6f n=1 Tax=Tenrec ecaudatus TaxID=94439 RepID=UPI003F592B8D